VKDTDLDDILNTAKIFDGANDITGLLVYNGRNFMRALEGEPQVVKSQRRTRPSVAAGRAWRSRFGTHAERVARSVQKFQYASVKLL